MNKRLKQLIDYYGISTRQFEQKISVSNGVIAKVLSANTTLRSDILSKITDSFPDVNLDWLLTGKGEMLKPKASVQPSGDDLVLKILAEKDRRIEQLILEKRELEEQLNTVLRVSADLQAVTPPQSAGTQIDTVRNT